MRRPRLPRVAFLLLSTALFALAARADKVVATVPAGTQPGNGSTFGGLQSIAVNIATNKVYVANYGSANVTVIDGSDNQTTTIPVGANPVGVAVNPVTNRVYVTNATDGTVTAINGATDTAIGTIGAGTSPWAVAVNPITNKVYVLNSGSANITVIDAAADANTTTTVPSTGTTPTSIAINPVTNKIYIANQFGAFANHLTVLNGADNTTTGVATGGNLAQVVVDPATNMVYLGDDGAGRIMVVNGADNTFASYVIVAPTALALNPVTNRIYAGSYNGTGYVLDGSVIYNAGNPPPAVTLGTSPIAAAVNPVTNKSYIVNQDGTVSVIDGESSLVHSVTVGSYPNAVAVNPVTNKIYVANTSGGTVSVIDGVTDAANYAIAVAGGPYHVTLPITAGTTPNDIAVNPISNKAYVANQGSDNVTVIDGSTTIPMGATLYLTAPTATVAAGSQPTGVAVDPFRNVTYVANKGDSTMTTIDALNNASSIFTGTGPGAVAVNPVTNMIYVANTVENTVSVIDGATGLQAVKLVVGTQPAGGGPKGIAIDPNTNKTFVANYGSNNVTIIDGNNHYAMATVGVGTQPIGVAVNPKTGKAYVANYGSNNATIIDTANLNATTTVVAGTQPMGVTVDPSANKAYVGSQFGPYHVAIIDGARNAVQAANATNEITAIAANPAFHRVASTSAGGPAAFNVLETESATNGTVFGIGHIQVAIATDPVTGRIYEASSDLDPTATVPSNVVAVNQDPPPTIADPLTIAITAFANNTTQNATPSFTFTVSSAFAPTATVPNQVYYQVDGVDSLLRATDSGGGTFTGVSPALTTGPHVVYAFATDGQEAAGGSTFVGALAKSMFLVLPAGTAPDAPVIGIAVSTDPNQATVSFSPPPNDGGSPVVSYTVTSSPDGVIASGTSSPITVPGLTTLTAYTFTVVARNAIGTGPASAPSNVVTPQPLPPVPGPVPPVPAAFSATAISTSAITLNWSTAGSDATAYWIYRSSSIGDGFVLLGSTAGPPIVDPVGTPNKTYIYKVRASNSNGSSPDSAPDVATTIVFTDPALTNVPASTTHIAELRTAINAMLAAASLPAATFTDPTLVGGTTPIKAVHVTELRSALDQARAAIGVPPLVYTDPTITPGDTILKAAHLEELRAGTQ